MYISKSIWESPQLTDIAIKDQHTCWSISTFWDRFTKNIFQVVSGSKKSLFDKLKFWSSIFVRTLTNMIHLFWSSNYSRFLVIDIRHYFIWILCKPALASLSPSGSRPWYDKPSLLWALPFPVDYSNGWYGSVRDWSPIKLFIWGYASCQESYCTSNDLWWAHYHQFTLSFNIMQVNSYAPVDSLRLPYAISGPIAHVPSSISEQNHNIFYNQYFWPVIIGMV